jgi:hypothetical protein
MIDLEEIKKHRRYWEPVHKENLPTICEHVDALVEEVERLRKECGQAYLQGVKAGRDAERIAERAAAVAFLRETLATSETAYASDDLDYAIAIIERGAHRREGDK